MQSFNNLESIDRSVPVALMMGKFDGFHLGHQKLLSELTDKKPEGCSLAVLTFDNPPSGGALRDDSGILSTVEEKRFLFEKAGIDYLFVCPFTKEFMETDGISFLRQLNDCMNLKYIICGDDFCFGFKRSGNTKLLREYEEEYGYRLIALEKLKMDDKTVSSTLIREEMKTGNVDRVNHYLGHPYIIRGEVVLGKQLGRVLGFPTANVMIPEAKMLPDYGVYAADIEIDGEIYKAITDIGLKPTVSDTKERICETHIPDFNRNIYGKTVTVYLKKFIRPEKQFDDIIALKSQISHDVLTAKEN